ncbi:MAG: HD domain-containing phosphohydrolase [Actinomycetota bacterium]
MTPGPTTGASDDRAWTASPVKAFVVRALVAVAPAAASFAVASFTSPALWRPEGWVGFAVFLFQIATVGSAAALLTRRAGRRFLPLASLLNMTLVFPDRAPSRFAVALRSGTLKRLTGSLSDVTGAGTADHQAAAEQLVAMVGALSRHDRLTRGHTERVRAYSALIGSELGLNANDQQMLQWAALVHDVGKLAVPAEILNQPGRPSKEEWAILANHPVAGGELLEPLAGWLGPWRLAASQHHERWDGTGYPSGLGGNDISLAGRIVAVADAYDVITSKRSYKQAMTTEAARQELVRCSGTQFDPQIVRALLEASLRRDRPLLGMVGWFGELGGLSSVPRGVGQAVLMAGSSVAVVAGVAAADEVLPQPVTVIVADAAQTTLPPRLPFADPPKPVGEEVKPAAQPAVGAPPDLTTTPPTDDPEGEPLPASTTSSTVDAGPASTTPPPEGTTTTETTPWSSSSTTTAPTTTTTTPPTTTTTTAPTTTTTTAPPSGLVVVADSATVEEGDNVRIFVLDNDDDGGAGFDLDTLAIVVDPPNGKSFRVHDDHLHYRSNNNFEGVDVLRYRICDNAGACAEADVTITVIDD